MVLTEEITSTPDLIILYIACIGFISAIIITLAILLHVILNCYALFSLAETDDGEFETAQQSKIAFILVSLYCIAVISSALSFGSIFSNLFTTIDPLSFTPTQCIIGYVTFYSLTYLCNTILYILFTWRIQQAFNGSMYEYKSYVYSSIYIISVTLWISWTVYLIFNRGMGSFSEFTVYSIKLSYTDDHDHNESVFAYCATTKPILFRMQIIPALAAFNFVLNITLLFMFNRGLWVLNKELMKGYVKEQIMMNSSEVNMTMPDLYGPGHIESVANSSASEDLKQIVNVWKTDGNKSVDAVQRVIKLHNLIKKQTILVCLVVISTSCIASLGTIDNKMGLMVGWDLCLNAICAWMMLSTSQRYWNLCKDYGLCKCCYLKTGKV